MVVGARKATSVAGSPTGGDCSRNLLTMEKIVAFAATPMPMERSDYDDEAAACVEAAQRVGEVSKSVSAVDSHPAFQTL